MFFSVCKKFVFFIYSILLFKYFYIILFTCSVCVKIALPKLPRQKGSAIISTTIIIMNGQYIRNIDRKLISEEDTFHWLMKGDLKAETEREIVAAQDQALQMTY
jgi:hypothetical protein